MTTSKSLRIPTLLFALLIWAGCDSDTIVEPGSHQSSARATELAGPEIATFKAGTMQTVDYYAQNLGLESIEVQVLRAPEGSDYEVTEAGGSYRKKVSLNWNPGPVAGGQTHEVALFARSESGQEAFHLFDIYVEP